MCNVVVDIIRAELYNDCGGGNNMEYCTEFGKRLREARLNANKSQRDISEAVGISSQMVSAYEKQERKPSIEVAAALAGELGVSLDYLCGIQNAQPKKFIYEPLSEMLSYIAKISGYFDCSCAVKKVSLSEEEAYDSQCGEDEWETVTEMDVAVLYIKDHSVTDFVRNWIKMYTLYEEKVISIEILEAWYCGEIEKYSSASKHVDINIPEYPVRERKNYIPLFGFDVEKGDVLSK